MSPLWLKGTKWAVVVSNGHIRGQSYNWWLRLLWTENEAAVMFLVINSPYTADRGGYLIKNATRKAQHLKWWTVTRLFFVKLKIPWGPGAMNERFVPLRALFSLSWNICRFPAEEKKTRDLGSCKNELRFTRCKMWLLFWKQSRGCETLVFL